MLTCLKTPGWATSLCRTGCVGSWDCYAAFTQNYFWILLFHVEVQRRRTRVWGMERVKISRRSLRMGHLNLCAASLMQKCLLVCLSPFRFHGFRVDPHYTCRNLSWKGSWELFLSCFSGRMKLVWIIPDLFKYTLQNY